MRGKRRGLRDGWEASISRRTVLKGAVAMVGMGTVGGIPGILQAGQAPAYPKGTKLHLLTWNQFLAAADKVFIAQAEEYGKQMGVEIQVERIALNSVLARTTAAIAAQTGPDIIILHNNSPHLLAESLVDVSDVAEALGKEQGGYYDLPRVNNQSGGQWLAVPQYALPNIMAYREDWLKEAGFTKFPDTWDEFREVGKKLKAMGRPIGQAFGHSENDPNSYSYPLMWSFGGMEVEKDGRVALDKKGTLEAIKYNTALWKDALDEGGLSWDDSSNNRTFLAGSISVTQNGASIYITARDKFPDIYKTMNHGPNPRGPAGRFYHFATYGSAVMKYSKNQKLAKEFVRWYMAKEQYEKWFITMDCYVMGPTKVWYSHPIWGRDPKLTLLRDTLNDARHIGYAGPPGRKASEALAKYIVVDMFAKGIQGATPEDAVKWAADELRKIYSA
jgi:multiple sugar transport system substrate-binding protein